MVLWFGAALVRIENERYALVIGLCKVDVTILTDTCLAEVQTRTSWLWHLYYALL